MCTLLCGRLTQKRNRRKVSGVTYLSLYEKHARLNCHVFP